MNFKNILHEIEKADPEVYEKLSPRRHVLKSFGSKVAIASLPFALGTMFKKAYGSTGASSAVISALNFALELEYLEYNFYHTANNTGNNTTSSLVPAADQAGFISIEGHEKEHIAFLTSAITTLGGVPYTPNGYSATAAEPYYVPTAYDFTAGGAFEEVFSDYATFLAVAQTFEDTGVRAYKGQLPNFIATGGVLTQALQIQSVEARHAAHVRLVRRFLNGITTDAIKPWITDNIPTIPAVQANYNGENNTIQSGITITGLADPYYNPATVPMTAATEAFDEPLDGGTVLGLVSPFIKS